MKSLLTCGFVSIAALAGALGGCGKSETSVVPREMTDEEVENLVQRSYQYVAMYNVNNKFALKQGGWNTCDADTELKDHTMREIARPNNDTLYITCMLDLRREPVVLDIPAFGSDYTSLMITAYDHYVTVPMSTRVGDFGKPEKMLLYSAHTQGYDGEEVDGIDRYYEATGDFVSAVFRVMPHAGDPERLASITERMEDVQLTTLLEHQGGEALPMEDVEFPAVGRTDFDVFQNNLLEVMQFVFNHLSLDPADPIDQGVLAVYRPLGVEPGKTFDPEAAPAIDGARIRASAERIAKEALARTNDPEFAAENALRLFQPKGEMSLEMLVIQSVTGPIGLPAREAIYPPIVTADGEPMNAQRDYVITMAKGGLPPATAFWSVTLYDLRNGFFISNGRRKYSVGKNAGMKLDDEGGIAIYIAAEHPDGVPEENWLPIERKDEDLNAIMRIYAPDLERYQEWTPPQAKKLEANARTEGNAHPPQTERAAGLIGTVWQWTEFQDSGDEGSIRVGDPQKYTLTLGADDVARIQADCNRLSWTYEREGPGLTFNTLGPSTLAYCGDQSLDQRYLELLGNTATYVMAEGQLYLNLKADSGNMVFIAGS